MSAEVTSRFKIDPDQFVRRLKPMAEPIPLDPPDMLLASNTADTFGWDTVFAISFNATNEAIRHAGS